MWNWPVIRWVRNFLRRRYLRKMLGTGAWYARSGEGSISCDFCARPGCYIYNGVATCARHTGFMNAEHLRCAVRLSEAELYRPGSPANS